MPKFPLQKVEWREVKTFFSISEMLSCGHRYESLNLLADPLTAKYRACPICAKASLPEKKPAASVRYPANLASPTLKGA